MSRPDPRNGFIYAGWAFLLAGALVTIAFVAACGPSTGLVTQEPLPSAQNEMHCVGGQLEGGQEVLVCTTHEGGCRFALSKAEQFHAELGLTGWTDCSKAQVSLTLDQGDAGP